MDLIADGLLISAACVAALYCHVLARRLRRLGDLDAGLGGAIAALSRQAEDLRAAIDSARGAANESSRELTKRTARAEAAAGRLEILISAMHDAESRAAPTRIRAVAPVRSAPKLHDGKDNVADGAPAEDEDDDLALAIRSLAGGGRS
ncbi:MAG: hypothetical protein ACJAVR_000404 [Paracoccaceae bacterium]|jgi:hypothetical protein